MTHREMSYKAVWEKQFLWLEPVGTTSIGLVVRYVEPHLKLMAEVIIELLHMQLLTNITQHFKTIQFK